MLSCRRTITALTFVMFLSPFVYSDILQMSVLDGRQRYSAISHSCEAVPYNINSSNLCSYPSIADLDLQSVEFSMDTKSDIVNHNLETKSPIITKDRLDNLNVYLSALISLGLCSSVRWMKKHSLGFIPEWYHNGGPFQIGHGFALMPDTLYPAPAYCFIQPDYSVQDIYPEYYIGTIVSLLRKSQFPPTVLPSRGPPTCY